MRLLFLRHLLFGFLLFFSFALSAQTLSRPDGSLIHYTLKDNQSNTLAIFVHGGDCHSYSDDDFINHLSSRFLPTADKLFVDKYGTKTASETAHLDKTQGCSEAYIKKSTPQQRIDDYLQVIASLNLYDDYEHVIIIGHCEGVMIAEKLTTQLPNISATFLINGGSRYFRQDLIVKLQHRLTANDYRHALAQLTLIDSAVKTEKTALPDPIMGHNLAWWRERLNYDRFTTLNAITSPVFIAQTLSDRDVDVSNALNLISVLRKSKNNMVFITYDGLDHAFKSSNKMFKTEQLIEDMTYWLDETLDD